jgi:NADH-quinone oxidoreductase subunit H
MRAVTILFGFGLIIGALFGAMALAYALAGLAAGLFAGADRLANMLVLMLLFVMIIATLLTIAERKWSALMQDRIGPNRARINLPGLKNSAAFGIPHVAADSLKMLFKEDFIPAKANRVLFELGPILSFAPVFALFAIIPAGPSVAIRGHVVDMVVATPDFGLLYLLAIASLAVYGTSLAGWASNNKFALLGGVRASSQMISYEVALALSLVGMMIAFSTVQLAGPTGMTDAQAHYLWRFTPQGGFDIGLPAWGIFLQPLGFVLFFAAAFAETKRAPFDVPEGESEIIGYFVEYSGMKFGMFMISEFVEIVVLSGVLTAIFFGGYHLPFGEEWLSQKALFVEHPWLWGSFLGTVFWIKVLILCWLQLAIRWTVPRFRYDQIQTLGWKILLPLGLVNVFLSGALILWDPSLKLLALVGLGEIFFLAALTFTTRTSADSERAGHGHDADHSHGAHAPSAHH